MPTPYGDDNFHTRNIHRFADKVAALTDGALTIEVHSGGSLFAHGDIADAVERGDAQIGEVFQSTLSARNPLFSADGIPLLATSYDQAEELYQAELDFLKEAMADDGLIPLFAVPWPPQGLYSKTEISDPDELRSKAFRVNNATLEQMAVSLGAEPVRLEVKDIPDAFRRGEIDLMITSATTGASTKSWEYLGYYYDLQAWLPKNIVFVNRAAFEALPQLHQDAVLQAAAEARSNGWLMSQIDAIEAIKMLFENGMTILTPGAALSDNTEGGAMREASPELLEELSRVSAEIKKGWSDDAGPDGVELLTTFEARAE